MRDESRSPSPERDVVNGHLMRSKLRDSTTSTVSGGGNQSLNKSRNDILLDSMYHSTLDRNTWSKREEEWYNLEEKLIFKNNTKLPSHGTRKAVDNWMKALLVQKAKLLE